MAEAGPASGNPAAPAAPPAAPPSPAPRPPREGGLGPMAWRGWAWLQQRLTEPERPNAAIEVRARSVGLVRVTRHGRRVTLAAAAGLDLPEGTLRLSMTQPNVLDPAAFARTLRALLERAGALAVKRVGLVLPDPVARVALLPAGEVVGRGRKQVEEVVRFKLRKSVPFEIREAQVAVAGGLPQPGEPTLVAAMAHPVLQGYEQAMMAIGLHPGRVELSGLSLLSAAFGGLPPGDRLLVNWDDGYVTLVVARGERPLLVRTLAGEAAAQPDEVAREVANTVLYYRERLGGAGLDQAVLRSAVLPPADAAVLLAEPIGRIPEPLDPGKALAAPEMGPLAQVLAGASASLLGTFQ
ncbi:MAG TPA: hypothetical protein VF310_16055 [Vicinamibacteria bacterium]